MRARALAGFGLVALLAACTGSTGGSSSSTSTGSSAYSSTGASAPAGTSSSAAASGSAPRLEIQEVAGGLEHPWDLAFLPDGQVLVTERGGALVLLSSAAPGARRTSVDADLDQINARGEGGLMGLVLSPDFATSREFITCETHTTQDIRLVVRRLSADGRTATRTRDLLTGFPVAGSGRHSGCRMAYGADGMLYVGTGDTADPTAPQDRSSLGGKVLRIDPRTGGAPAGNPFASSSDPHERLVWTYGHRNVQGIAVTGDRVYSAEHGPDKNDEVNLLKPGANYGWDPGQGGSRRNYDESVPMTDTARFPDAVGAVWQSGDMTEAICAATFLTGEKWGSWQGAMVVTALRGAKLLVLQFDPSGSRVTGTTIPPEFADKYGRLRAARVGPGGAVYVTTSNGSDDKVLRVVPS